MLLGVAGSASREVLQQARHVQMKCVYSLPCHKLLAYLERVCSAQQAFSCSCFALAQPWLACLSVCMMCAPHCCENCQCALVEHVGGGCFWGGSSSGAGKAFGALFSRRHCTALLSTCVLTYALHCSCSHTRPITSCMSLIDLRGCWWEGRQRAEEALPQPSRAHEQSVTGAATAAVCANCKPWEKAQVRVAVDLKYKPWEGAGS
eukprot:1155972-Pelagomonas_calceolata.AAC.2